MEAEILQDLKAYFGEDFKDMDEDTLLFCIRRAIRSFKSKRKYPDSYSDDTIAKDMDQYYACVFDVALYWCNMQGSEFQTSHSESGVSRSWETEDEIYAMHHIVPIARII